MKKATKENSTENTPNELTGRAIDGPLKNAQCYVDINNNNQKDSVFNYWYSTGKIFKKVYHNNGVDSILEGWNHKGEQTVINGEGELIEFYNDGSLKGKLKYHEGKLDGQITKWYEKTI